MFCYLFNFVGAVAISSGHSYIHLENEEKHKNKTTNPNEIALKIKWQKFGADGLHLQFYNVEVS